ncbi:MAG: hypothetical protein IPJ81_10280 [Chitinophagaceae bacterium]|nr:hypothetical protein [Chitinophagaceae bacterium]
MSLDNIQLPAIVLQDLFKKGLIDSKINQIKTVSAIKEKIEFLGKNEGKILILVNHPDCVFLPDAELNFLIGILTACKLTLNDVAIVNFCNNKKLNYEQLQQFFDAAKIFAFDVLMSDILLPLQFPVYQVQQYNEIIYMHAPPLQFLKQNKEEKLKLCASLQKIFSI